MDELFSGAYDECVELALKAGQGSEEALDALQKHPVFWEQVLKIIRLECRDRPGLEDQVEAAFYRRFPRRIRNFRPRKDGEADNLWAWIRIVIRHIRLSLHRRSRRFSHDSIEDRPNLIDDKPDPIHKLIIDDMMSKVLTPKQSRALKLTVLEGLTLKETASLLGFKSPTSVWHLVQIAKRKLRKALAGESVPCLPNQIIKQED